MKSSSRTTQVTTDVDDVGVPGRSAEWTVSSYQDARDKA